MMSKKQLIYDALKPLNIPISYADSNMKKLPKITYNLVSNTAVRLSGKRHTLKPRYQIDFYSDKALDVETDTVLTQITEELEKKHLLVTPFKEIVKISPENQLGLYRYMCEVV